MSGSEIPGIRNCFYIVQARLRLGTEWVNEAYPPTRDAAVHERDWLAERNPSYVWRVVRQTTVTTREVVE